MSCFRVPARGFGILGMIFVVLLLFGVSCGGSGTATDVSKSVSTDYDVSGVVWCDHDDNGEWSTGDHGVSGARVYYSINGGTPTYVTTDKDGKYYFYKPDQYYADVWVFPYFLQGHYSYCYPQPDQIEWTCENQPWRVPANVGAGYPLRFVGSDNKHP